MNAGVAALLKQKSKKVQEWLREPALSEGFNAISSSNLSLCSFSLSRLKPKSMVGECGMGRMCPPEVFPFWRLFCLGFGATPAVLFPMQPQPAWEVVRTETVFGLGWGSANGAPEVQSTSAPIMVHGMKINRAQRIPERDFPPFLSALYLSPPLSLSPFLWSPGQKSQPSQIQNQVRRICA